MSMPAAGPASAAGVEQLLAEPEGPAAQCVHRVVDQVVGEAARITRGARQRRLRIDATWRWAAQIATAWQRIRNAFG